MADFIFDHFDDLISYNSAELAQLSGVSKATVSRLFKRLGYEKYKDMRDELRTLRQSGMPLTDNRDAVQGNTLLARHYKQEMANLTQWVNARMPGSLPTRWRAWLRRGALSLSGCVTPIRRRCTCVSSYCRRAGRCWYCRNRGKA